MRTRPEPSSQVQRTSRIVMVNCTGDTFTIGHSGAIATWIHETCLAAQKAGVAPHVITRYSDASAQLPWGDATTLHYPTMHRLRALRGALRRMDSYRGYPHERQRAYARRVHDALTRVRADLAVFHNDPEIAVLTKARFPHMRVAHIFHNQNPFSHHFLDAFRKLDHHIAVSNFTAAWADGFAGLPHGTTRRVLGGVNGNTFGMAARRPTGTPVIGFLGLTNQRNEPPR